MLVLIQIGSVETSPIKEDTNRYNLERLIIESNMTQCWYVDTKV